MARFLIHNTHKSKVLGQPDPKDPKDYAKFTPLYFGETSVFLKPGEKTEVAGCDATVNLIVAHVRRHAAGHEFGESLIIKELSDAAQTINGEPIWVVVVKEDVVNPHTKKQVEFPLAAHSCGRTWFLQPGANEMTQFCAEGIKLACGWAVEAVMSRTDYEKAQEKPEEETEEETEEQTEEQLTIAEWGRRFRRKGISNNEIGYMEAHVKDATNKLYTREEFLKLWDKFCKQAEED